MKLGDSSNRCNVNIYGNCTHQLRKAYYSWVGVLIKVCLFCSARKIFIIFCNVCCAGRWHNVAAKSIGKAGRRCRHPDDLWQIQWQPSGCEERSQHRIHVHPFQWTNHQLLQILVSVKTLFPRPERAGRLKYSQVHKTVCWKGYEIYVLGNQILWGILREEPRLEWCLHHACKLLQRPEGQGHWSEKSTLRLAGIQKPHYQFIIPHYARMETR